MPIYNYMKREYLEKLIKEELIEIILKLQQEIERLKQRIEELERKIGQLLKTSHNSSLPPSKDYKVNTKQSNSKKKGPSYGHIGKSRLRVENPDIVNDILIESCKGCGKDLSNVKQHIVGKSQMTEIPKIEPVIIETCIYETKCPYCGEINRTEYPEELEPHRVFGPQISAYVNYFVHKQHLSRERVEKVMEEIFGLKISQGAIDNMIRKIAENMILEFPTITMRKSRDVRNSVIHRKVIGGFRSQWGAKAYSIFTSISQTALRKGVKVIDILKLTAGRGFHIEFSPILISSP